MNTKRFILDDPEDAKGFFEDVPDHDCVICGSKFNSLSGGMELPEGLSEKYCPECVAKGSQVAFIKDYCNTINDNGHEAERLIKTLKPI